MNKVLKRAFALFILDALIFLLVLGAAGAAKPCQAAVEACGHDYFPLRAGDEIEYRNMSNGQEMAAYTMRVAESKPGWARLEYVFPGNVAMSHELFCDQGVLRSDTYMDIGSGLGGQMQTRTETVQGDFMPKDLETGAVWITTYNMATTIQGMEGVPGLGEMKMTVEVENTAMGREKITVPAGTFSAMKVKSVSRVDMSGFGYGAPTQTSSEYYMWLAKGVGLVKTASAEGAGAQWETVAVRIEGGGVPFFDNPTVEAVAEKAVAPAAAAAAVANSAIAAQATLSVDVARYLIFFVSQPVLLFRRRKRKAWGTVYNSLSRLPEDLAIVRLRDAATGRLITTEVTDKDGRFSFLVAEGKYKLEAKKANFVFPTELLKGKKEDSQYADVYHGAAIQIGDKGAVLTPNIPVDPQVKTSADASVLKQNRWRRIQAGVALAGPVLGGVSFIIKPSLLVTLLFLVGIVVYLFFRRFATTPAPKSWGVVREEKTSQAVGQAILRVFALPFDRLLETRVTDARGRYNFKVGNSRFYMTVTKQGYKKEQTQTFDFTAAAEPEVISEDVELKKAGAGD